MSAGNEFRAACAPFNEAGLSVLVDFDAVKPRILITILKGDKNVVMRAHKALMPGLHILQKYMGLEAVPSLVRDRRC